MLCEKLKYMYLAGSLFSQSDRSYGTNITKALEEAGNQVYWPWRDAGDENLKKKYVDDWKKINATIVERNLEAIRGSRAVVALVEGADVESGTSMEVGYAHALKIPIFGIRTDFRTQGDRIGEVNIMLSQVMHGPIFSNVDDLIRHLDKEQGSDTLTIEQFYDEIAVEYADTQLHPQTAAARRREHDESLRIIGKQTFETVIDIGCGPGDFLQNVQAKTKIGIDCSLEMIKHHRRSLHDAWYIVGDSIPHFLAAASVNLIHCAFVLDHINDLQRFFNKIERVLVRGGDALISNYSLRKIQANRDNVGELKYYARSGHQFKVHSNYKQLDNLHEIWKNSFQVIESLPNLKTDIAGVDIDYYHLQKR